MNEPQTDFQNVNEAALFVKSQMPFVPKVGIILGTGLGGWVSQLQIVREIHTAEIPHMRPPRVASHRGHLSFAELSQIPVAIFSGRIHYYEGYDMQEVVRPVRLLHQIGCTHIVITNAAGGLNPAYEDGDIVIIRDHINLMHAHPLRGPNEERWGTRFPDMMHAYDKGWIRYVTQQAENIGIQVKTGIYAGNSGPSMETPAEYAFLHRIGADLVGMSAVPEVIAAHHIGLKILALSVVSNMCYPPERIKETTVEEVIRVVETSAARLGKLVEKAVQYSTDQSI